MKNPLILLAAMTALGLSAAVAAPPVKLNDALATKIPPADQPAFYQAVADALNHAEDGQRSQWSSTPKRAHAAPISVTLTPLQTSQRANHARCRLLSGDFSHVNTRESWQFWFCQQADGRWKASHN